MNGFATPSAARVWIEGMCSVRRDWRPADAGPDIARVEEERTGRLGLPLIVAGDLGDGDRVRPWAARFADLRHLAAAHETELAALEDDAAIAGREAARFGAIDDDTCDRKLAEIGRAHV